jgi:hypothetical protein
MFPPLSAVEINNTQPAVFYGADFYSNDGSITHAVNSVSADLEETRRTSNLATPPAAFDLCEGQLIYVDDVACRNQH